MYSATKFNNAKIDLAYSILHQKNADHMGQVEIAFLRSLLSAAAQHGRISDQDIQRAIEKSGACELAPEAADSIIAYLWQIGDQYIGALSPAQAQELRKLRHLCLRANNGDLDAMMTIADMI
jgi:hypothetical protein